MESRRAGAAPPAKMPSAVGNDEHGTDVGLDRPLADHEHCGGVVIADRALLPGALATDQADGAPDGLIRNQRKLGAAHGIRAECRSKEFIVSFEPPVEIRMVIVNARRALRLDCKSSI